MSKGGKVYLWICLALFIICILFYKPLNRLSIFYFNELLSVPIGFLYGLLAAIHFNVFWGVDDWVERVFGSFLVFVFGMSITGGILEGLEWIMEHVRIIP